MKNKVFWLISLLFVSLLLPGCSKSEVSPPEQVNVPSSTGELGESYWVKLGPIEDMETERDDFVSVSIAFGLDGKWADYFEIAVDAPDFVAEYPEKIVVDGVNFTEEDYHVPYNGSTTYQWLPGKFTLTLTRIPREEIFSNTVRVEVTARSEDGGSGARKTVEFYYYGGPDKVCFSAVSTTEAKELYENAK